MRALRDRYSGLCHPTYMLDVAGDGKVVVGQELARSKQTTSRFL
jgi:L-lysine 2,3-aminomutase